MIPPLPRLMVAPNGARLTRRDHPALPVTLPQILETARACFTAGADGFHLHIRDETGGHLLDACAYREAIAALFEIVPGMAIQITTEAVGKYLPAEQRDLVRELAPSAVSIGLREMIADGDEDAAVQLYSDCAQAGTAVQHILYAPEELRRLATLLPDDLAGDPGLQVLLVLGSHGGRDGTTGDLTSFLIEMSALGLSPDWAACCFGPEETTILSRAHAAGGKIRIGFENNLRMADGRIAPNNAARVTEVLAEIERHSDSIAPAS